MTYYAITTNDIDGYSASKFNTIEELLNHCLSFTSIEKVTIAKELDIEISVNNGQTILDCVSIKSLEL